MAATFNACGIEYLSALGKPSTDQFDLDVLALRTGCGRL